jgi:hypothetical protein
MERFRVLQPHFEQNEPLKSVAQAAGIPIERRTGWFQSIAGVGLPLWYVKNVQTGANGGQYRTNLKMPSKVWLYKSRHCLSLLSIDRCSSSRRIEEKSRPATGLSSTLSEACPPISLLSPMTGRRRTATHLSWCTGEKRMGRTQLASRSHAARHSANPPRRCGCQAVAHHRDRRLQSGRGWVFPIVRRPIRAAHISGFASGYLAQRGLALDRVRHP